MWAANNLALALRHLGDYAEARRLDEESLAREQRLRGKDHRFTLVSASNLARDLTKLGEHRAARELDEDTLTSASNLADDLRALGEADGERRVSRRRGGRRCAPAGCARGEPDNVGADRDFGAGWAERLSGRRG
jgi:hypothetical protein